MTCFVDGGTTCYYLYPVLSSLQRQNSNRREPSCCGWRELPSAVWLLFHRRPTIVRSRGTDCLNPPCQNASFLKMGRVTNVACAKVRLHSYHPEICCCSVSVVVVDRGCVFVFLSFSLSSRVHWPAAPTNETIDDLCSVGKPSGASVDCFSQPELLGTISAAQDSTPTPPPTTTANKTIARALHRSTRFHKPSIRCGQRARRITTTTTTRHVETASAIRCCWRRCARSDVPA